MGFKDSETLRAFSSFLLLIGIMHIRPFEFRQYVSPQNRPACYHSASKTHGGNAQFNSNSYSPFSPSKMFHHRINWWKRVHSTQLSSRKPTVSDIYHIILFPAMILTPA